jgi:hypothetical protein
MRTTASTAMIEKIPIVTPAKKAKFATYYSAMHPSQRQNFLSVIGDILA